MGGALLILIGAVLSLFFWAVLARPARHGDEWVAFDAPADRDAAVRALYHQRLIDAPGLFGLYWSILAPWSSLREGSHLLEYGLTARELVQRLSSSPSRPEARVTVPEGANRWEIAERLQKAGVTQGARFLAAVSDAQLLRDLGIAGQSAEGYLFPATYPLGLDSSADVVVRRMVREMRKRLIQIRRDLVPAEVVLTLSELQVLTLASIVEKETAIAGERPRIAQVFYNRLAHPEAETLGRLQSDPTAAYGCRLHPEVAPSCAEFAGKVTPKMLGDSLNTYNTYRRAGLPPGPIGNPGLAALRAALQPSGGDELYFVADGKGGHAFSRSFEEHRAAVEALRQRRQAR